MPYQTVDVAIVGAGSAGAAAAALLAERGLKVVVLERRALADAGARWINGVPRSAFRAAGFDLPEGPDTEGGFGAPVAMHLVAGAARVVVRDHDVLEIDMRRLVAWLQARAARAGVSFRDGVTVHGRDDAVLRTSAGAVRADRIVDASGLGGARLLGQPATPRHQVCAAAQEVRAVVDPDAARAYFAAHRVPAGEILGLPGVAGGFSVLNVRYRPERGTVGILTGSIPALGHPSGRAILDDFVASQPWIGARDFGGSGAIPLGVAHARLTDGRVALIGDAARQVFPAHGSGVGAGILAARLVADTIAAGAPLRDYEVQWQRRVGGLFAMFEAARRWSETLDATSIGRLIDRGLLDVESVRAGMEQVLPRQRIEQLPAKARALLGEPRLAGDLISMLARSAALRALYATYPKRAARVASWERRVEWLLGDVRARAQEVARGARARPNARAQAR